MQSKIIRHSKLRAAEAALRAGGTSLRAAGLRDTGCWCCAHGMVRFPAGWFAASVLQAAGEENKFWKIRDFVNSEQ